MKGGNGGKCILPETIFSYKIVNDYIRYTLGIWTSTSHILFGRIFSPPPPTLNFMECALTVSACGKSDIFVLKCFSVLFALRISEANSKILKSNIEIDAMKEMPTCIRRMFVFKL